MTMKESLFLSTSHSADFLPNLQKYTWFKFLEYYNFIKQLISRAKWTPPTMTTTTVTLKMAISWHSRNWKLTIMTKMALWHWVSSQSGTAKYSGCARFPDILQSCVVHQVFGRKCLIVFLTFTPKLPIQTSLSVAPTGSVFWFSTQFQQNEHIPAKIVANI